MSGNPPSRHLWVGGLPEEIGEAEIKELFTKYIKSDLAARPNYLCSLVFRYGKVEGVKILPQRYPNQGVAAFIDFYDVRSAVEAKDAKIVYGGCELRTNFKTKPTERFEHSRRDLEYGKEQPYSGKRVDSPSPTPEKAPEKEKEKIKDKEKSRGKERYI